MQIKELNEKYRQQISDIYRFWVVRIQMDKPDIIFTANVKVDKLPDETNSKPPKVTINPVSPVADLLLKKLINLNEETKKLELCKLTDASIDAYTFLQQLTWAAFEARTKVTRGEPFDFTGEVKK